MRKFWVVLLAISFALGLWGCAGAAPAETPAEPTTEAATVPTEAATEAPETTAATEETAPPVYDEPDVFAETVAPPSATESATGDAAAKPEHSVLYDAAYSQEQIWSYFQEVVLDMEYSDGAGDVTLVQKWTCPIYYRIYGVPTEEDLAVLEALFAQLNQIPGFPGIYKASGENPENCSISFLGRNDFTAAFSDVVNGEDANAATQFFYYTETNEIYSGRIGYRTDLPQAQRSSILVEEMINMLGISDTTMREDSIVYQYSDDNMAPSAVDWIILKLLYDPAMCCGFDATRCQFIVSSLYY